MKRILFIAAAFAAITFAGCDGEEDPTAIEIPAEEIKPVFVPDFNADSAYKFIETQVDFGPRVPNTPTHGKTANWLVNKLKQYTPDVTVQTGTVEAFDGTPLHIQNIFAKFHPDKNRRILLVAHWDTRPFADQDTTDIRKPIAGANDGGSGVGVILEIARQIQQHEPDKGVSVLFVDAEDYGAPSWATNVTDQNTYCLGTQYWAKNLNSVEYIADYAIVLDMVGAKGARFLQEGYSVQYAPQVVENIWREAAKLGYSNYFIYNRTNPLIDDHLYINAIANIPAVDIVDFDAARSDKGFGHFWHTHEDDMDIIDRNTLKAVGQTVLSVIYK